MQIIEIHHNDDVKKVQIDIRTKTIQHISNIRELKDMLIYEKKIDKDFFSYRKVFLIDIGLELKIDDIQEVIEYQIIAIEKYQFDKFNGFSNDVEELFEHQVQIIRIDDFDKLGNTVYKPYFQNLIQLIETYKIYPFKIEEEEFYQFNPKAYFVIDEDLQTKEYGLFFSQYHYEEVNKLNYNQKIIAISEEYKEYNSYLIEFRPVFFQNFHSYKVSELKENEIYFKEKKIFNEYKYSPKGLYRYSSSERFELQAEYNKLLNNRQEPFIKGKYNDIVKLWMSDKRLKETVIKAIEYEFELAERAEKKQSFDVNQMVNWSNYNDDLNKDEQGEDFYNQF